MLPLPLGFDDKPRTPLWCQENGSIPEAAVCGLASIVLDLLGIQGVTSMT